MSIMDLSAPESTKKTKVWQEQAVKNALEKAFGYTDYTRKSDKEIRENVDIAEGRISKTYLSRALNPLYEEGDEIEADDLFYNGRTYALINDVVKVMGNDELRRPYKITAYSINPDEISSKEEKLGEIFGQIVNQVIKENPSQEEVGRKAEEVKNKAINVTSEIEDLYNNVLNYLRRSPELDLKKVFNRSFRSDKLKKGSFVLHVGFNRDDIKIRKVDPENLFVYGIGEDGSIDESEVIVEKMSLTATETLELLGDKLTKAQKDKIKKSSGHIAQEEYDYKHRRYPIKGDRGYFIDTENSEPYTHEEPEEGGDLVIYYTVFLTYRTLGKLKSYDEDNEVIYEYVDSSRKPDKSRGEEIEYIEVEEYWHGYKVLDMYVGVEPIPEELQFRSPSDIFGASTGYVGEFKKKAFIDDLIPYAVDYIVYVKKLRDLWVTNFGKVARIDMGRIPKGENWDENLWMKWVRKMRVSMENSFNQDEAGNVAGHMNQNSGYIDWSAYQEISQAMQYLEYLETKIEDRSGVNAQRKGDINQSAGLGTTQNAIARSNNRTDDEFSDFESAKRRVYEKGIKTVSYLWKNKNIRKQFMLDDNSKAVLKLDQINLEGLFAKVIITDGSLVNKLANDLDFLIQGAIQQGYLSYSAAAKIKLLDNPRDIINKLEEAEEDVKKREEQKAQMEARSKEMEHEKEKERAVLEKRLDIEKAIIEKQWDLRIEYLKKREDLQEAEIEERIRQMEAEKKEKMQTIKSLTDLEKEERKAANQGSRVLQNSN